MERSTIWSVNQTFLDKPDINFVKLQLKLERAVLDRPLYFLASLVSCLITWKSVIQLHLSLHLKSIFLQERKRVKYKKDCCIRNLAWIQKITFVRYVIEKIFLKKNIFYEINIDDYAAFEVKQWCQAH